MSEDGLSEERMIERRTAQESRQGRRGRPVLVVLAVSVALMIAAWAGLLIWQGAASPRLRQPEPGRGPKGRDRFRDGLRRSRPGSQRASGALTRSGFTPEGAPSGALRRRDTDSRGSATPGRVSVSTWNPRAPSVPAAAGRITAMSSALLRGRLPRSLEGLRCSELDPGSDCLISSPASSATGIPRRFELPAPPRRLRCPSLGRPAAQCLGDH